MVSLQQEEKSALTIYCKDGSKRIIKVIGRWSPSSANSLGRDLEGPNFKFVTVTIL